MTIKRIILIVVAILDLVLVIVVKTTGYSSQVLSYMVHSETTKYNWYYKPRTDGLQPERNAEMEFVYSKCNGYSIGNPDEKIIYLTFDMGYDIGYTEPILDALKKHDVKAAFFVVGHYIDSCPDIVKRMADEGHIVCNHTVNHKDMTTLNYETFKKEITGLEDSYFNLTGKSMDKFYRPPSGTFSERSLTWAKELGYSTVFWSFAYADWYTDNQPERNFAINKIMSRTHPGEVVLLHATSKTNAEIMDEIITKWKQMGYRFEDLYHLTGSSPPATDVEPIEDTINQIVLEEQEQVSMTFSEETVLKLGNEFGLKWDTFTAEQLAQGMNVELEHGTVNPLTNITDDDPVMTMKIALAHLYEYPDYYDRLLEMEEEAEEFWSKTD